MKTNSKRFLTLITVMALLLTTFVGVIPVAGEAKQSSLAEAALSEFTFTNDTTLADIINVMPGGVSVNEAESHFQKTFAQNGATITYGDNQTATVNPIDGKVTGWLLFSDESVLLLDHAIPASNEQLTYTAEETITDAEITINSGWIDAIASTASAKKVLVLPQESIGIRNATIPTTVEAVIFEDRTSLQTVYAINLVSGDSPFAGTELKAVVYGDNIGTVPQMAFQGAKKLKYVQLSPQTTVIERNAFSTCNALETLDLSVATNLQIIDGGALKNTAIREIVIPASVTQVGALPDKNYATVFDGGLLRDHLASANVTILSNSYTVNNYVFARMSNSTDNIVTVWAEKGSVTETFFTNNASFIDKLNSCVFFELYGETLTPPSPPLDVTIQNSYLKLKNEKELNVAYFGGSLTVGTESGTGKTLDEDCWRSKTNRYLAETFDAEIYELSIYDIATRDAWTNRLYVGGYGSFQGMTQLDQFLNPIRKPDLVFIEYAVNDEYFYTTEEETSRYIESIIRRLYTVNPQVDIVLVVTTDYNKKGALMNSSKAMISLGRHYGLTVVNAGEAMQEAVDNGLGTWEGYFPSYNGDISETEKVESKDVSHPNAAGYAVYAQAVQDKLQAGFDAAATATAYENHTIPAAKNANYLVYATLMHPQAVVDQNPDAGLTIATRNYGTPNGTLQVAPGKSFTITFEGTSLGMWMQSAGTLEYVLDNATVTPSLKAGTAWKQVPQMFFDGLDDTTHTLTVTNPSTNTANASIAEIMIGKSTAPEPEEFPSLEEVSLAGKKVVAIGDSLTQGDYGSNPPGTVNVKEKGYPYFFAAATGATVDNQGHCGATSNSYWNNAGYMNALDLADADVILIMLGTNQGFSQDELDKFDKYTSSATDYNDYAENNIGRYASLIEYCQEKSGDALIVLMTPPVTSQFTEERMDRIVTGVNKLATKYGLQVIDNYNNCGITLDNIDTYMPVDGLHCGEEGYKLLGEYIATQTETLYRTLCSQPYLLDYKEVEGEVGFNGRWFDETIDGKVYKATFTAGSELYFKVTGTTKVYLSLKTTASQSPCLAVSVDGRTPERMYVEKTGKTLIAANLDPSKTYTFRVIVDALYEYEPDKWTNRKAFVFDKAMVDNGGTVTGLYPKNKKILYFGDSITEGIFAMGNGTNAGPTTHSAMGSYHFTASRLLNAVSFPAGYGGSGITVYGSGNAPRCYEVIDKLYANDTTGVSYPELSEIGAIVLNHGTNDNTGNAARGYIDSADFIIKYKETLAKLTAKFSGVQVFCVVPFGGSHSADIATAVTEFKTDAANAAVAENVTYLDLETRGTYELADEVHPTAKGGKTLGTKLANAMSEMLVEEAKDLQILSLKTENMTTPIGLDVTNPTFSWTLSSTVRGQSQSAYRVMVATSAEMLQAGTTDVWDSGFKTGNSYSLQYNGAAALKENTVYYWQVQVKDKAGAVATSDITSFETGLMTSGFGDAQFITTGSPYLSLTDGSIEAQFSVVNRSFILRFLSDENRDFYYAWKVTNHNTNGQVWLVPMTNGLNNDTFTNLVDHVDITSYVNNPTNLAKETITMKITVQDNVITTYINGNQVDQRSYTGDKLAFGYVERCKSSPPEESVFAYVKVSDTADTPVYTDEAPEAAPLLRREFTVNSGKTVAKARLYATALGVYDVYLNGERVGDNYLAPGRTEYTKKLYYQTYDITSMVKSGNNAVGAVLGNGWFNSDIDGAQYGTIPVFLGKLVVTYTDGTTDVVVTDKSWKTKSGPMTENDFYTGTVYDARREVEGWTESGLDESGWGDAATYARNSTNILFADWKPVGTITGQAVSPIKAVQTFTATEVTNPKPNVYVYNLGQNIAGFPTITFSAPAGTQIKVDYGEVLTEEGVIRTDYLSRPEIEHHNYDVYTFSGNGNETFSPTLVYRGFQYIQIEGLSDALPLSQVTGTAISTDMDVTGTFESSNEQVNQYFHNTMWSQYGNSVSTLTDCPTREKNGWSGDAQIFLRAASFNMDVRGIYSNFLEMLRVTAASNGIISQIAPNRFTSTTTKAPSGWSDAIVTMPWDLYLQYGDKAILEVNYDAMKGWVDYLRAEDLADGTADYERPTNKSGGYCDHLSREDGNYTQNWAVETAYSAYSCLLLSKAATVLGKTADASTYLAEYNNYKTSWQSKYLNADGYTSKKDLQIDYVLGLYFDLFAADKKQLAADRLAEKFTTEGETQKVGYMGLPLLYDALTDNGYADVAYKLLESTDAQYSLLYSVTQGATTTWEIYEGGKISHNHYSLGSPVRWLYSDVLGISHDEDSANAGYQSFSLRPTVGGSFTYAKGSYESARGTIVSDWKTDADGTFSYKCTVPVGSTARLYLPIDESMAVTESGNAVAEADGVTYVGYEDGCAVYDVVSGSYAFTATPDTSNDPVIDLAGASLTLYDNITVNYMIDKATFDAAGCTDPYMVFELNGQQVTVNDYVVANGYYQFAFDDVAPDKMNDVITSTAYATYNGRTIKGKTRTYSIATYCYNMLKQCSNDAYAEFRTMLVDLLNYGAATQTYTGHNTTALANANLTEAQKAWASATLTPLNNMLDKEYAVVENPRVTWEGAGMVLNDAITMNFLLTTEDVTGLTVKISNDDGFITKVDAADFVSTAEGYVFSFSGLDASEMRECIYLTVYDGDTAVSNTVRYSIESYAYAEQNSSDANLATLVQNMMKYGDAAYAYKY